MLLNWNNWSVVLKHLHSCVRVQSHRFNLYQILLHMLKHLTPHSKGHLLNNVASRWEDILLMENAFSDHNLVTVSASKNVIVLYIHMQQFFKDIQKLVKVKEVCGHRRMTGFHPSWITFLRYCYI
jgi:hypothetical protein